MIKNTNKKGAVEMSLNLIIMLVIGLTILGLIIGFVTNFLGEAGDQIPITEDDKIKLEQVEREAGNFAFLSGTLVVTKNSDKKSKLYMKIRNPSNSDFEFIPNDGLIDDSGELNVEFSKGRDAGDDFPTVYGPAISLKSGEVGAYPLEVVAEDIVLPGTYYGKFTVNLNGEEYSEIVTIEVQ